MLRFKRITKNKVFRLRFNEIFHQKIRFDFRPVLINSKISSLINRINKPDKCSWFGKLKSKLFGTKNMLLHSSFDSFENANFEKCLIDTVRKFEWSNEKKILSQGFKN